MDKITLIQVTECSDWFHFSCRLSSLRHSSPCARFAPRAHLSLLDIAVIAIYFVMVIWIGFYLKRQANTSEEFFMAGREMTAWIAGLSFVSANLGSLELMGWAGSAYQYGILAAHWYWVGAIPAMLFLGMVMMPFYYVCKTHSVPGYLKLRYGQGASIVAAFSFAFMTVLMSGVNMFAMAEVMKVVLGWDLNFSIIVSSLAVAAYVALGGLRSAIFNEVLQFMLIWGGALLVPILGLIEAGGWNGFKAKLAHNIAIGAIRCRRLHAHVAQHGPLCRQPDGHSLDRHRLRPRIRDQLRLLDDGFSGRAARARRQQPALGAHGAGDRLVLQNGRAVHRDSARPAGPGGAAESRWQPDAPGRRECCRGKSRRGTAQLQRSAAADDGALLRPGLLGLGITALIAGFMSGMAGNVSAFSAVWTYDIYQPLIVKKARDEHYVAVGRWATILGVVISIGTAYLVMNAAGHHGLCAGAVQLLHFAAARRGADGHVLEARHQGGRLLGTC